MLKVDDLAAPHTLQTLAILGTQPEVSHNIILSITIVQIKL